MKKFALTAMLVGVLVAGMPAGSQADTTVAPGVRFVFAFAGSVPCAVACAYWDAASAAGYRPCENPFPDLSYKDVVTQPAPTPPAGKKMILDFTTTPDTDWDTWICTLLSNGSHNGGELAAGANILGELCANRWAPDTPVPVGCEEEAEAPAEAGIRYVLRASNWSPTADDPALNN